MFSHILWLKISVVKIYWQYLWNVFSHSVGYYDCLICSGSFCPGHIPADALHDFIRLTKKGEYNYLVSKSSCFRTFWELKWNNLSHIFAFHVSLPPISPYLPCVLPCLLHPFVYVAWSSMIPASHVSLWFICHCLSGVLPFHVLWPSMCRCLLHVLAFHVSPIFICRPFYVSLCFMCHCLPCVIALHVCLLFI